MKRAVAVFEAVAPIRTATRERTSFRLDPDESIVSAVPGIVARHPMTEAELRHALAMSAPERAASALLELERSDRVQVAVCHGTWYWVSADAYFPESA